jgi:hypothetical protein
MPRRVLMLVLLAVYTLVSAAGSTPAQAQTNESLGKVTLRWTMTVQGSDTFSKDWRDDWTGGSEWQTEKATDQLTLRYEGEWTWQVTRDGADGVELDRGQGEYSVSGSGGGSQQIEHWDGPKAAYCQQGGGGYWVPVSNKSSAHWAYQATAGDDWHVYAGLSHRNDEMTYWVKWDWDQQITLDGTMLESSRGCSSSSSSEQCGTSTFYGGCPGAGAAELMATLYGVGQAMPAWERQGDLRGTVRPEDWGFSVSGSATYNPEPQVEEQATDEYRSHRVLQSSAVLAYTLTYEREPTNLEAVITIPFDEYEQWQPEAGRDEDTVGNQLRIEAELRYKDRPDETPVEKATFRFHLLDTTREPGVCLNAPAKDKAKDTLDLKIDQDVNLDLQVEDPESGQAASTLEPARAAGVTISSYDWGAYGRLRVTATTEDGRVLVAHLDGQPEIQELTIPLDDNGNHTADAWEQNEGVLGKNLPADWDGSPIPRGLKSDGDGIALYEKYRGFEFGVAGQTRHERLVALARHIFVYDPDGIVLSTMVDPRSVESSLSRASQCRVRFVDDEHWTGAGESGSGKRLVNFNSGYGHAVDQHALDVRLDDGATPTHPPAWAATYEAATGAPYTGAVGGARGMTYPDYSTGRSMESPQDAFRIVVFSNNIWQAMRDYATFHTQALPEFASAASDVVAREVARYTAEHMDQASEAYQKQLARVISHEAGHALGVNHHDPLQAGDKTCVMRYTGGTDCPRNADDRFELACYNPWPHTFCTSGANCWGQVQVSDR